MAVTGDGTEQNPYIVETWDEMIAYACPSSMSAKRWVKIADNTEWDMNELYPDGISSHYILRAYVDGNNAIIKNLRAIAPDSGIFANDPGLSYGWGNFSNIRFENTVLEKGIFLRLAAGTHSNVVITGIAYGDSCFLYDLYGGATYANSGFDVELYNARLSDNSYFLQSKITVKSDEREKTLIDGTCKNCFIGGSLKSGNGISFGGSKNIVNVKAESGAVINCPNSIVNSELANGADITALYSVTDAQMKSPDYLRSIGFPMGV